LLVGYEPGSLKQAAVLLKAYQLPGEADPRWWVVDEF
jgi:hypothetical protein